MVYTYFKINGSNISNTVVFCGQHKKKREGREKSYTFNRLSAKCIHTYFASPQIAASSEFGRGKYRLKPRGKRARCEIHAFSARELIQCRTESAATVVYDNSRMQKRRGERERGAEKKNRRGNNRNVCSSLSAARGLRDIEARESTNRIACCTSSRENQSARGGGGGGGNVRAEIKIRYARATRNPR